MDGSVHVLADDLLIDKDGVLVVVALPGHEADQGVLAQADLAVLRGGAVGQNLALDDLIALADDGALVDAGALVRAHEFDELVFVRRRLGRAHRDLIGSHTLHNAVVFRQHAHAGVARGLVLHAGGDDGLLGDEQRYRLTLHVRAHEGTVCVVVLQERDHSRSYGHNHLRADVHVVHALFVDLKDLIAPAAGNTGTDKTSLAVQLLVGLRYNELILHIGGHIDHFIGNNASGLVHLAVRRFNKAVLIDLGERGQIGNQADVRTFRRLDGAHAAVMGIVYVADLEACAVTGQAAGAESRQTAFVRQLCQRVVLIHELGQRRGAKELLDGCHHRTDVDERLRRHHFHVLGLQRHALTDDALHAGKADAELVLQQLAHTADPAVAQMVDVVHRAHAVAQAVQVVDGCENIIHGDCFADETVTVFLQQLPLLVHIAGLVQDGAQFAEIDALVDAAFGCVKGEEIVGGNRAVGDDLDLLVVQRQIHQAHARFFGGHGSFRTDLFAGSAQQLARQGGHDITGGHKALNAAADGQLLVHLIAAEAGKVVPARVKKQTVDVAGRALHRGRLARTQLAVRLQQAFFLALGGIFCDGGLNALVLAEEITDLRVVTQAQRTDEHRHRDLAVLIDAHIENVVGIRFVFQPRAAVGVQRGGEQFLARLVVALAEIHARGTDELRDDNTLGAVDDEGAGIRHERKIAHEDLLLLHFAGLLVQQTRFHAKRGRIGDVALLALLDGVLGLGIQPVVDKVEHQVAGVVFDRRNVPEDLFQALFEKPLV